MRRRRPTKRYFRRYTREGVSTLHTLDPVDVEEMRAIETDLKSADWPSTAPTMDADEEDFGYLFEYDDARLGQLIRAA